MNNTNNKSDSKGVDVPRQALYPSAPYGGYPYGAYRGTPVGGLLTIRHLWAVAQRKWVTILLVLLFAGVAAAYYLWTTPKLYRASALIELSVRRPRIMNQQAAIIEDPAAAGQSDEIFNTRLEKFRGQSMQEATLEHCRKQNPDCMFSDQEWRSLFQNNLTLALLRRTRLIKVEFVHSDPRVAAQVCAAFAETAATRAFDENRVASDAAVAWLEMQAAAQAIELNKADNALLKYRQDNKIDALESQRKTVQDALMDFNKALVAAESRETAETEMLNTLASISLTPEGAGKLPDTASRADEIKTALVKWMEATSERDGLLSRYTVKHPEVEAKNKMVALYHDQALEVLSRSKATSASNLELARKQAASFRKRIAEQSQINADLELQIVERRTKLVALERTRDACDAAYRGILNRIQEARMAADETTATVKIVERPMIPERPFSPRPTRTLVLAMLLGLAAGLGLAVAVYQMEDHLADPVELEVEMGIKILAMIPHVRGQNRKMIATASISQQFSEITEAFAGLRTMLMSTNFKDRTKVILVASSIPEEGKTIVSCNLAGTLARNGRRVLLIDFDMRRPRIAGIFPMPPGTSGLAEFLHRQEPDVDFSALVYASNSANLSVIGSRPTRHASPAELVAARHVGHLIAWAREHYDHVIIDAPPLGLVSDALVLAGHADCTLVIGRPGVSRKRSTLRTIHRLHEAGVATVATVVNDVDLAKLSSSSSYYHSYRAYKDDIPGSVENAART